jgi:hypothetical protein
VDDNLGGEAPVPGLVVSGFVGCPFGGQLDGGPQGRRLGWQCAAARAGAGPRRPNSSRTWPASEPNVTICAQDAQLLARIVHVLEIENSKLKQTNAALEQQVAAQPSVPDLTRRRRRP